MTVDVSATEPPTAPPPRTPGSRRHRRARPEPGFLDIVDEWGEESFPASDPPSNW